MTSKNLWGDLSKLETIRSPKMILEEQAVYLTRATKGVLVGFVDAHQSTGTFEYDYDIQIPALNNYAYTVLSIRHDVDLYPVVVRSARSSRFIKCEDEQQYEKVIASILGSKHVKQVVARLLSQAT